MPDSIRKLRHWGRLFAVREKEDAFLDPHKTELIDFACRQFGVKSFADLLFN